LKYLSRKDIEAIGERVTKAYFRLPDLTGKTVYKITPDKLITDLLGFNLEYHHLSLDGSVLGLTSSYGAVTYKVFDYADEESYCYLDGKTIFIERDLNEDISQIGRCNFTKAHEAGHQILKILFPKEYGGDNRKLHFCLAHPPKQRKMDWLEWQVNAIASVILMPKEVIMRALFLLALVSG